MPSSCFMTVLQCSALATGSHLAGDGFTFSDFTAPCPAGQGTGRTLGPPAAWFYLSFPLGLTSLQSTTQSCWSQVLVLWYPDCQELREKLLQGPSFALHEKIPIKLNPVYAQVGSYRIQALVPALCILRGQLPTELAKGKHRACRSTKL